MTGSEGACYVNEHSLDHARTEELVTALVQAGLTGEETVMLERAEREQGYSDEERAYFWSETVGYGAPVVETFAHLSWLRIFTRNRVLSPRFQRLEYSLAPRLLEAEVLGGRAVRQILRAADPKPPIRKGTS